MTPLAALPPPPSLYIHIPFCRRRCPYCAFASQRHDPASASRYMTALEREFDARAGNLRFLTAFIGGGTPTILEDEAFQRLLALMRRVLPADSAGWAAAARHGVAPPVDGFELSIEANPKTIGLRKLIQLREAGATRLSLGAQTFDPLGLRALGRRHNPHDIERAVAAAGKAGFRRVSLDLIYGWEGQTDASWRGDLDRAADLGAGHLSCYALSVEEGTPLARRVACGQAIMPSESALRRRWEIAGKRLGAAGLKRYEISNYAKPGHETRHHWLCWTGGEYAGLGLAAHSHQSGRRFSNTSDLSRYENILRPGSGGIADFSETLPKEAKARETLVTWLRMAEGVDPAAYRLRTGFDLPALIPDRLLSGGWLEWRRGRLRLADKVFPVADSVLSDLV